MHFRRISPTTILCTLAFVGSVILYAPTLRSGFMWDDYHFIRPYSLAEVLGSFTGSWDATHVEVGFYRPLTVLLAALRFQMFGFAPAPYHLLSIGLFAVAAALFGGFVLRVSRQLPLALASVGLFLVHPAMIDSLVAWVTNQFQLLQIIVFLGALHWWLTMRARGSRWWLPLIVFESACFLFKEDGIMLLPVILLVELIWRYVRDEPRRLPRGVLVTALVTPLALVFVRRLALHTTLAGYGLPPVGVGLHRMLLGPVLMLTGSFGTGWVRNCSMILISGITIMGCIAIARGRHQRARFLLLTGAAIMMCFGLPVYLAGRDFLLPWHFLALGHVCILLGCVQALYEEAATVSLPDRFWPARALLRLPIISGPLPLTSSQESGRDDRYAPILVGSAVHHDSRVPAASDRATTSPVLRSEFMRISEKLASPSPSIIHGLRSYLAHMGAQQAARRRLQAATAVRGTLTALVVLVLCVLALVVHEETRDWDAQSVRVQCTDRQVIRWGDTVPDALRQALAHKGSSGQEVTDDACVGLFPS